MSAGVQTAVWVAQLLLAVGLFVGTGGAFFAVWLVGKRPLPLQRALIAVMTCGLVAALALVPLQGFETLAKPLGDAFQPRIWVAGIAGSSAVMALVAVATFVAGLLAVGLDNQTITRTLGSLAFAGIGLTLVTDGPAITGEPRFVSIPVLFLHGLCAAFWIGALLPLAFLIHGRDEVALERFSRLLPAPLVVIAGTAIALACFRLDRLDALWSTVYGRLLSIKIAAVLSLLALDVFNRRALALQRGKLEPRRLVVVTSAEFVLAVAILGVVGLWRFTPSPVALAAADATFIHFHGEQAMASINLETVRDRGASLSISLTDSNEQPIAASNVTITVSDPSAGIAAIERSATANGEGEWQIAGLHIPVAGVWRMRVDIQTKDSGKISLEDNVELPRAP